MKAEEEKEVYLILVVHGIGANLEAQKNNESGLHEGMQKVTQGGHLESKYHIVTHVVDWKTEVEKSFRFGHRLKQCAVPSKWMEAREAFDNTVPDCLAYLNPRFRPRILETLTQ